MFNSRWISALVVFFGSVAIANTTCAADGFPAVDKSNGSLSLHEALDGYAKSVAALRGYDVSLTSTMDLPLKTVIVEMTKPDPNQPSRTKTFEWRPWEPGETPRQTIEEYRQVLARDGKRRVEINPIKGSTNKALFVDDRQTLRVLGNQGMIEKSGSIRLGRGEDDATYLGKLLGMVELLDLVRERPGTRLIENADGDSNIVGVLLPAEEGESLRPFEFRVWLDRRHGFAPAKIQDFRKVETGFELENEAVMTEVREAMPGVWAPIKMKYCSFNLQPGSSHGKAVNVYQVVVDIDKSRWGANLEDELFALEFPEGTRVVDLTSPKNMAAIQPDRFDLATVRENDRAAAAELLKYGAKLKANPTGAIISLSVQVDHRFPPGFAGPNLDDRGLTDVGKLADLEELHVGNTEIIDDGLANLAGLSHLKVLVLENTKITDDGLQHLSLLASLKRLYLDNNMVQDGKTIRKVQITDAGLVHLRRLAKLEQLLLNGTEISDAGLLNLANLTNLKSLHVNHTNVTLDGAKSLNAALPQLEISIN